MIRGYNLVPWEKLTLPLEEAKHFLRDHYMYGWTLHAYLYTPRSCSQKGDWNEFVNRFKLLLMGIHKLILQKLHGKTIVWSLQNYILYIDKAKLCQYKKWLLLIVCVLI
jgi:hypothetical protein